MKTSPKTITSKGGELTTSSNRVRIQFQLGASLKVMKVGVHKVKWSKT